MLEAWGGVRASRALTLGSRVVPPKPPRWTPGRLTTEESGRRDSILTEAIALIMAILAVASWAGPLSRQVGTSVLEQAIVIALPMTLALQWAIRSRYLSRRSGLACLAHDRLVLCAVALLGIELPLMLLSPYGPLAGMFVAIWVGGTVLARRGWALPYGFLLVAAVIGLQARLPAYPLLGGLTAIIVVAGVIAVRVRRRALGRTRRPRRTSAVGGRDRRRAGRPARRRLEPGLGCTRRISGACAAALGARQLLGRLPPVEVLRRRFPRAARGGARAGKRARPAWPRDEDLPGVAAAAAGHHRGALRVVIVDRAVDIGHEQVEPVCGLWLRRAPNDARQPARVAGVCALGVVRGRGQLSPPSSS